MNQLEQALGDDGITTQDLFTQLKRLEFKLSLYRDHVEDSTELNHLHHSVTTAIVAFEEKFELIKELQP